jgi:hypothetical protein
MLNLKKLFWSNIPQFSKMPVIAPILQWKGVRDFGDRVCINRALSKPMPPVLVYQMGKVASMTITETLSSNKDFCTFHVHRLDPENIARFYKNRKGWSNVEQVRNRLEPLIYNKIIKPGFKAKIITLFREPISRNVSSYFHSLDFVWNMEKAHEKVSLDKLIEGFFDKHIHYIPIKWFDYEFKPVLGINIYDYEFPKDLGYLQIKKDPYEALIMRYDLDDKIKESCIAKFIGQNIPIVLPKNVGEVKDYGAVYKQFLSSITFPESYVNEMLDSQYARHFYSTQEIDKYKNKWLKKIK